MRGAARRARLADKEDATSEDEAPNDPSVYASPDACWLCARPLGRRIEWHHPRPKSRGGRFTVPVHPICHRTLHATFTNADLARLVEEGCDFSQHPDLAKYLAWIADKPPDFHKPTRSGPARAAATDRRSRR